MAIKWNPKTKRFETASGREIDRRSLHLSREKLILSLQRDLRRLAGQLYLGKITPSEFRTQAGQMIKAGHVVVGAISRGGRRQTTKAAWAKIGTRLKRQYKYLDGFLEDIRRKKIIDPNRLMNRAGSYAQPLRVTWAQGELDTEKAAGKRQARRLLRANESCVGCTAIAFKWFDIDEFPPIGSLQCGGYCRCVVEYR